MQKTIFKIHDKIRLTHYPTQRYYATHKDIAEITSIDDSFIYLKWLTKTIQNNGGYFPDNFELCEQPLWETCEN